MDHLRAEKLRPTRPVEFAALPPGALAWAPPRVSDLPEDRIVRGAFAALVDVEGLAPARARELGRAMGGQARAGELTSYLDAFSHLGLGTLALDAQDEHRAVVLGHGVVEGVPPTASACALALGFVEGALAAIVGGATLGSETRCRSHGHAACTFFVRARRA